MSFLSHWEILFWRDNEDNSVLDLFYASFRAGFS